jgi:hypothetical protein
MPCRLRAIFLLLAAALAPAARAADPSGPRPETASRCPAPARVPAASSDDASLIKIINI